MKNFKSLSSYLNFTERILDHPYYVCIGVLGLVARNEQSESSDVDIYYEGKPIGLFSVKNHHIAL
ncbi:MAG: hypothetical protein ACI30I_05515 [Parabacteroides sp.]